MGRAKQLWMEMEEFEWEATDVFFNCPECGNDTDGWAELPVVFEGKDADEFPIEITCSSCDETFDAVVSADWDGCTILLNGYPDVEVDATPIRGDAYRYDDWEHAPDWEDYLDVSEPYRVYTETRDQLVALLAKISDPTLVTHSGVLLKMMLVQSVTALEAYLADTLIYHVKADPQAQLRLIKNKKRIGINQIRFGLDDAFGVENFAEKMLSKHLTGITYHNLKRVQAYFEIGLQTAFKFENDELEVIHKGIRLRHDCVHRNGKPVDADDYHEIEADFLRQLIAAIHQFATRLEQSLPQESGSIGDAQF